MRISMASTSSLPGSLSSILLLSLLTSYTYAQLSNLPDLSTATQASSAASAAQSTASSDDASRTSAAATTAQPSSSDPTSDASSASVPQTTVTDAPALSTTTAPSQTVFHLTDVPILAGVGIPTQVIPYTAGAPFMQKSNLPEGTVFICVGAILGVFGASILAWHALVAWSLHRSVRRAALAYNFPAGGGAEPKLRPSGGDAHARGLYAAAPAAVGSTLSLDRLAAKPHRYGSRPTSHVDLTGGIATAAAGTGGGGGGGKKGPTNPSATSLFFSPTASPTVHAPAPGPGLASGSSTPRDRGSTYLPAGYYASSAAAPCATHPGGAAENRRSTAGFANRLSGGLGLGLGGGPGPQTAAGGYARVRGFATTTPPGSPGLGGPGQGHYYGPNSGPSSGFGGDGSTLGGYARSSVVGNVGGGAGDAGGLYSQPSSSSATLTTAGGYGYGYGNGGAMAGLGVPGGTNVAGGRAPSAYLEDLFEHHGNGMRERF